MLVRSLYISRISIFILIGCLNYIALDKDNKLFVTTGAHSEAYLPSLLSQKHKSWAVVLKLIEISGYPCLFRLSHCFIHSRSMAHNNISRWDLYLGLGTGYLQQEDFLNKRLERRD